MDVSKLNDQIKHLPAEAQSFICDRITKNDFARREEVRADSEYRNARWTLAKVFSDLGEVKVMHGRRHRQVGLYSDLSLVLPVSVLRGQYGGLGRADPCGGWTSVTLKCPAQNDAGDVEYYYFEGLSHCDSRDQFDYKEGVYRAMCNVNLPWNRYAKVKHLDRHNVRPEGAVNQLVAVLKRSITQNERAKPC